LDVKINSGIEEELPHY